MPFIKAKNGNVVEFSDEDLGKRAKEQGHEVVDSDPRKRATKKSGPKATEANGSGDDK